MKFGGKMKFNFYRKGCKASRFVDTCVTIEEIVNYDLDELVDNFRQSKERKLKDAIPAICPMGINVEGSRKRVITEMESNGLAMIDLDHVSESYEELCAFANQINKEALKNSNTTLAYITCSGSGLRFIFPLFEGMDITQSAVIFLRRLTGDNSLIKYLDTCITDISRLSILTKKSDYFYYEIEEVSKNYPTVDEIEFISSCKDIKDWVKSVVLSENKGEEPDMYNEPYSTVESDSTVPQTTDKGDEGATAASYLPPSDKDSQEKPYKLYSEEQVIENDRLYADFKYKGRLVRQIAESFVSYKTKGMGPERGERHALYSLLCKNFRNVCDNDPRILHAVLPTLNHLWSESWKQCYYYTSVSKTPLLPKDFWYWLNQRGLLDHKDDNEDDFESEEDKFYNKMLEEMPPLPPIIREFVKSAPKWFKIPVVASLQCYTALLATNYRSFYFDGAPLSTTLYSLIYAPAASGKGYVRRLKYILKSTDERDKLAIKKAKWYDQQQRQNNGSGKLPEEVVWKQRLFASKTSLGEILKRQEAIGEHHWLQDVGEFSIWAATIKKNKEEWSAFFRTSYDNEEFSQSYQSANAYRGKVPVYPIVHGTCTLGQIQSFFTNVEDGLLTRFSFIPLLHQRYAEYQPWKLMNDKDQMAIDKVVKRLESETYQDTESEEEETTEEEKKKKGSQKADDSKTWDYEFKDLKNIDLSYLWNPILGWLEKERKKAQKDDNEALDTFRRRCARNAFIYGIICRALWGKDDKKTRELIIRNMLWDADLKLYYMRYLWEEKLNEELTKNKASGKGMRNKPLYDSLAETFTRSQLEEFLMANGIKTPLVRILSNWRTGGLIKETSKYTYKKIINS